MRTTRKNQAITFLAAVLATSSGCGEDIASNIGNGGGGSAGGAPASSQDGAARDVSTELSLEPPRETSTVTNDASHVDPTLDSSADAAAPDDAPAETTRADVTRVEPDAATGRADADASGSDAVAPTPSDAGPANDGTRPGWRLVWRDEFDGARGTLPDSQKWTPLVDGMPANDELEYYTARPQNISHDGTGNLVITSLRESYMGRAYTSARMDSAGKFEQTYGRFESRIKLPRGQGLWPAFWIMGNNAQAGWPGRGEIDIMEHRGREPELNVGAMHGPGYSGALDLRATYTMPGGYASDFHVFAIEWEMNVVRFYVDDHLYQTRTPADLAARGGNLVWVYDHPFYVIFNVAVGGRFPGNPDATTTFPQTLTIDYVRVYAR